MNDLKKEGETSREESDRLYAIIWRYPWTLRDQGDSVIVHCNEIIICECHNSQYGRYVAQHLVKLQDRHLRSLKPWWKFWN